MFTMPATSAEWQIFDVDHTITIRSTGVRMGQIGVGNKLISRLTLMQFPLIYMRYRAGSYNLQNLPPKLHQFEGFTRAQLAEWGKITWEQHVCNDLFPPAIELIRHLKSLGRKIILCSSSLDFIIQPLADYLGAEAVIASCFTYDGNDVCTGVFDGTPAFGEGKVLRMQDWVKENHVSMDDMAFYSDSINDMPLLQKVKYPVPTNPDRLLRKQIRQNDWKYLEFRRSRQDD